jgi:adenylate kinase
MKNKAVIIYGPPGSGKSTQAELLVRVYNFVNFDTGRFLERELFSEEGLKNKSLEKERENFRTGKLCSPPFVLKIVRRETQKLALAGADITYSGSPRTYFEAFGDKKNKGLFDTLFKIFGKENVYIIVLRVSERVSLSRNLNRKICSVCGLQAVANYKSNECSLCYGKLKKRILDKPDVIKERLKEYKERTYPILEELKKRKFKNVHEISGAPLPYLIHNKIAKIIGLK